MSSFLKITILTKSTLALLLLLLLPSCLQFVKGSENIPLLYLGSHITKCRAESPESFYRDVAFPTLSNLQEEANGFFGVLMDKIEASVADAEKDEQANLEKKWTYLMTTIDDSLESVFQRIKKSWGILVSIYDTEPLPWEISIKNPLTGEFLNDLGYQYLMIDAVVKAGVKEIVGTLQLQLANVIQKLEKDVSKQTKAGETVTEMNLLQKMDNSLKKMKPNFVGNLLKKIVERAIKSRTPEGSIKPNSDANNNSRTFLTDIMEQTAIVLHAYRQKGQFYRNFWAEITKIMKEDEFIKRDVRSNIRLYNSNEEHLIDNIIAILTSSHKF